MDGIELKHYKSTDGSFELDVPAPWSSRPAASADTPNAVVRFDSHKDGKHTLVVFRIPCDPKGAPDAFVAGMQAKLTQGGFRNFARTDATIGSQPAVVLDFDQPAAAGGGTWSCRHYYVFQGPVVYTLGFGTDKRATMFSLYDEVAKTLVIQKAA